MWEILRVPTAKKQVYNQNVSVLFLISACASPVLQDKCPGDIEHPLREPGQSYWVTNDNYILSYVWVVWKTDFTVI